MHPKKKTVFMPINSCKTKLLEEKKNFRHGEKNDIFGVINFRTLPRPNVCRAETFRPIDVVHQMILSHSLVHGSRSS